MRISLNESSPHFVPDASLYEVFVDGQKIMQCFEACEETGRAWVLKAGDGGLGLQLTVMKGIVKLIKKAV